MSGRRACNPRFSLPREPQPNGFCKTANAMSLRRGMKCATAFPLLSGSCRKRRCSPCASCHLSRARASWGHYFSCHRRRPPMDIFSSSFWNRWQARWRWPWTIAELEHQQRRMSDALQEASKALDASEERFRDLFDEAPIAYVHEGLDSRFIRANRTAMKILGIKPEDVPTTYGKTFAPDTPDAQRRMREAFESIGRGTDTSGVVLEMRRKDNGKPFWIQWWSRPDPSGTYTRTMFLD